MTLGYQCPCGVYVPPTGGHYCTAGVSDTRTLSKVESGEGWTKLELGCDHTDGYRITVGWSDEDQRWIARASGMKSFIPGEGIGTGTSQLAALQDLACALCATVDCMGQALDLAEKSPDPNGDPS